MKPTTLTTTIAVALLLATVAHGCAYQLREPTLRSCAAADQAIEYCKADLTCMGATMKNGRGEQWGVLEELQRNRDEACSIYEAAGGKR